jgi:hypothetical protein
MSTNPSKYIIGTWATLVAMTAVSWWFGTDHGLEKASIEAGTAAILVVAFEKVALVGYTFMELRDAAPTLQLVFFSWCAVVGTVLVGMYLVV